MVTDTSDAIFPIGTTSGSYIPVTLRASTPVTDSFSITVKNSFSNPPTAPTMVVNWQWTINKLGTSSASLNASFGWQSSDEASGFVRTGIVNVMNYTAGAWTNYAANGSGLTGTGTFADPYIIISDNLPSSGDFGVTNGTAMPLHLISFSASQKAEKNVLNWTTVNELNAQSFILEKSFDNKEFFTISSVNAKNGSKNNYSFEDASATKTIVYYRLKMIDKDGSFTYSDVILVKAKAAIKGLSIYPNPAESAVTIYHGGAAANSRVNIFSVKGEKLLTYTIAEGATQSSVNVSRLVSGNYILQYFSGDNVESTVLLKK